MAKNPDKVIKKNARIARCRFLKNLGIWFLGVLFLPLVLVLAVCVIPVGAYANLAGVKTEDAVSENVSGKAIVPLIMDVGTLSVNDFPFLVNTIDDAINATLVGDIISIDKEKLSAIQFSSVTSSDFGKTLMGCINTDLTINGLQDTFGLDLGALLDIDSLNKWSAVPEEEMPSQVTSSNYMDYYYNNGSKYVMAYDKTGEYANGYDGAKTLYYPALTKIQIMEVPASIVGCLQRVEALELLGAFSEISNGPIKAILDGKKVKDLGSLEVNSVKVIEILPEIDDSTMNILCECVAESNWEDGVAPTKDTVTVGQLSSLDVNGIKIATILEDLDDSTAKILCESVAESKWVDGVAPTKDTLTVGQLASLNVEGIKITSILPDVDEKTINILCESVAVSKWVDGVAPTKDTLTVGQLASLNVNNIKLKSILPDDNDELWSILVDATGKTKETIIIDDLLSFDVNGIKLESIMTEENSNQQLWDILIDATGKAQAEITIEDLLNFDVNKIKLKSILPEDKEVLWLILKDATGKAQAELTVEDLFDFNVEDIKLSSVMDAEEVKDNNLLYCLVSDTEVTIGNIGDKLDELKVTDAFDIEEVFTESTDPADYSIYSALYTYNANTGVYQKSSEGTYRISKTASVWIFLLYETDYSDDEGDIVRYTENPMTFGELNAELNDIGSKISQATIKQLLVSGFLTEQTNNQFQSVYDKKLNEVINASSVS